MTATPNVIVEAATKGDLPKLSRLLYDHPDLADMRKEDDGPTPLMAASKGGHLGVVKLLLRCGVNVDAVDAHGWSALYYAGMAGHGAIVEVLLERSASVDIRDVCGWNALIVACAYGHMPVVLRLLEEYPEEGGKGICLQKACRSIDAQSTSGETAFWWACYFDHAQVAKTLLLRGADHSIADEEGRTPKGLATQRGRRAALAVIEWYEGEAERAYLMQRMRGLSNARHVVSGTPDNGPHQALGDTAVLDRCMAQRLAEQRPLPEWVGGLEKRENVMNEAPKEGERMGRVWGEDGGGKEEGKGDGKSEEGREGAGQLLVKEKGGRCGVGNVEGDTTRGIGTAGGGDSQRLGQAGGREGQEGLDADVLGASGVGPGCEAGGALGLCGGREDEVEAMLEWAREHTSAELFVELMQGLRLR